MVETKQEAGAGSIAETARSSLSEDGAGPKRVGWAVLI